MDQHIHIHVDTALDRATAAQLDRIERGIHALLKQGVLIMTDLTALDNAVSSAEAEVAAQTEVVASASTLLNQLSDLIRANATDQEALNALADRLSSTSAGGTSANQALADAIAANTPAAPPA